MAIRKRIAERLENYGRWFCCCIFAAHIHIAGTYDERNRAFLFIHIDGPRSRYIYIYIFHVHCIFWKLFVDSKCNKRDRSDVIVLSWLVQRRRRRDMLSIRTILPWMMDFSSVLSFLMHRLKEEATKRISMSLCGCYNEKRQESKHRGSQIRDHRYYYLLKIERIDTTTYLTYIERCNWNWFSLNRFFSKLSAAIERQAEQHLMNKVSFYVFLVQSIARKCDKNPQSI